MDFLAQFQANKIGAEVPARYTAKVGAVLSPLPLNQTFVDKELERFHMIRLSKVLIVSVAIAYVQSTSFAQEVTEEKATKDVSTKLDLIITQLQSIEERLRGIELKFDSAEHRSGTQIPIFRQNAISCFRPESRLDRKLCRDRSWDGIVPRRRVQTISPILAPGAVIKTLDAFDRNSQRKQ